MLEAARAARRLEGAGWCGDEGQGRWQAKKFMAVEYSISKILGRHQNVEYFLILQKLLEKYSKILRKCFQGTGNSVYSNYYQN